MGLALTIGLILAALSWVERISIPLRVEDPGGLVAFYESSPGTRQAKLSYPLFAAIRDDCQSCAAVASTALSRATLELGSTVDSVGVEFVSRQYFGALGIRAARGRLFGGPGSESDASRTIAVIGGRFARRHFNSGAALGSKLLLNGRPVVIAGILSGAFTGLGFETDVWLPLDSAENFLPESGDLRAKSSRWLAVFARLRPSRQPADVSAQIQGISPGLREAGLLEDDGILRCGPEGFPWTGRLREVALLAAAVGGGGLFALLALCLNVMLVVLAHNSAKESEAAVKLALGATRTQIFLERALELAFLATLGGGLAYLVARWLAPVLPGAFLALPQGLVDDFSGNIRLLIVAVLLAWLSTLAASLPFLFRASRVSLTRLLADHQTSFATSPRGYRFRKWLVGAQISMCILLIAAGTLLFRSVNKMAKVRVAERPDRLLVIRLAPSAQLRERRNGQTAYLGMMEFVEALPSVESATVISHVPLGTSTNGATVIPGGISGTPHQQFPMADILVVGPRFFRTMGLKLLAGRDFQRGDREHRRPVVAINETLAKRFWGGSVALRQSIRVMGVAATIVAVVENARRQALSEKEAPQVYLPFLQHFQSQMVLLARTRVPASAVAPMLRSRLEAISQARVVEMFPLQAQVDRQLGQPRFVVHIFLFFGIIILVISLGGVYSVASLYVVSRRRELGLRMALGAGPGETAVRLICEGLQLTMLSMIAGLAITFAVARILSHLLYGVSPLDPATIGMSLSLTLLTTILAIAKPLLQALRIQPGELLRST